MQKQHKDKKKKNAIKRLRDIKHTVRKSKISFPEVPKKKKNGRKAIFERTILDTFSGSVHIYLRNPKNHK